MLRSLSVILHRDIQLTLRQTFSWLTPLFFFVMVVCLFPLSVGTNESLLNSIAPAIIWVAALLAILMSIHHLFQNDVHEGYLELMLQSPIPLTALIFCKMLSHWLTHCLPLILITPLLALFLNLDTKTETVLILTLLLGTPVLIMLGAIGAALLVGVRGHGLLLPVLIIPLYIPVLIFGTGTILATHLQQPIAGDLAILGALGLISLAFAPLFTGLALRNGVNQ